MRAGPGAVLPRTLLSEGCKRGSQPFDLAMCIESHQVGLTGTRCPGDRSPVRIVSTI
jgi:hypothetical protein